MVNPNNHKLGFKRYIIRIILTAFYQYNLEKAECLNIIGIFLVQHIFTQQSMKCRVVGI